MKKILSSLAVVSAVSVFAFSSSGCTRDCLDEDGNQNLTYQQEQEKRVCEQSGGAYICAANADCEYNCNCVGGGALETETMDGQ